VGYIGLLFAGLSFILGKLAGIDPISDFSIWMSIISLILLFFGFSFLKLMGFPIVVLAFIIPLPPFINNLMTFKLKLLSSGLSVKLMQIMGISVYREGNIIDLGVTQLQVVDACSGLRYVFPIILIGLVMGYLFNRRLWERVLILLFTVPVAVLSNVLRIAITGVLAQSFSPEVGEGFFHGFSGWLIFMFATIFLALLSWLLRWVGRYNKGDSQHSPVGSESVAPGSGDWVGSGASCIHVLIAGIFFLSFFLLQFHLVTAQIIMPRKTFNDFFMEIGDWKGKRSYLEQKILDSLSADDYVNGTFKNQKTGHILYLLVPYYKTQSKRSVHPPIACLTGGGWELLQNRNLLPDKSVGRIFPVQQMVLEKQGQLLLANFWFQQRGRIITNEYLNKVYLAWDALTIRRTDGALVRVEMPLSRGQSIKEGQALLDPFIIELNRILLDFVPG
jgi:exosortase D (VPLPA-CTERM-specific)